MDGAMKLAIGSWAFLFHQAQPTTDFHELLHNAAHIGYEGVELHAIAPHPNPIGYEGVELHAIAPHPNPDSHDTAEKRAKLKRMVQDHGLEFAALSLDFSSERLVSVENDEPYIETFAKHLKFAKDLGIQAIRIDTAEPAATVRQIEPQLALDRVEAAFDRCAKLAADHGITVAWAFDPALALHQPAEIVTLVERVREMLGNPNFGVLFNTAHAHICSAGAELELLKQLDGKITHLHLIDTDGTRNEHGTSRRMPLGRGKLDFERLVPELHKSAAGCDWWTVDLGHWPDAWEAAGECRRCLHRLRRARRAAPSSDQ
jgi:sugar phosphate isomerase/epimerase